MGLSAALFSGITGLSAHGEKMSVLGNNIANVNTVGFKSSRMHFEDAISQNVATAQGVGQVGRGVKIGAILSDFSQGSFETTNESTDLAIGGSGFFLVKVKNEEQVYYTRAGNFRFDRDGYLVDPHGYVLQGWEVDDTRLTAATTTAAAISSASTRIKGVPTDIRLENFQSSPRETSSVTIITNLDSGEPSRSSDPVDPFFAMFKRWDGQADQPIGQTQYAYQTTLKVYDENGSSHNLSVFFDPVTVSNAGGRKVWEFIVSVPPSEDGRFFTTSGGARIELRNTSAAGLLATGTLTFNAAGELENMSLFQLQSGAMPNPGNLMDLSNWRTPQTFSQNGYPMVVANFLSRDRASFTDSADATSSNVLIELNFGLRSLETQWRSGSVSNAAALSGLPANGATVQNFLPGFNDSERAALATTSFSAGSTTIFQSQDGFSAGFLQNISVNRDGVLTGRYSNGQVLKLYVITLANFNNNWGLTREGGNLFAETRESGPAVTNRPNTAGLGSIASNSLEQSNVDMAREFVKMITTQRGFQANSKVITTTDTMLGELIQLKR
ncbi:flagellar hook-basal body protein [Alkalidesulfovibrio alkalitolerans DSM 16529]|uniref:Flagellar hook protein FlgE n=1 Tax=Alkalidesulfovibrio alkalitolerans DSM 16529 TaxID=1121439 RepID=S7UGI0_9BACT|nr:flagellar hook protein FlgE [Alkalidesulfovibrio alkalitolerans]EPR32934.1 flagellar hook-basal body protein [Alkalidesulfovibrio alkalitolerans DSM 16529]